MNCTLICKQQLSCLAPSSSYKHCDIFTPKHSATIYTPYPGNSCLEIFLPPSTQPAFSSTPSSLPPPTWPLPQRSPWRTCSPPCPPNLTPLLPSQPISKGWRPSLSISARRTPTSSWSSRSVTKRCCPSRTTSTTSISIIVPQVFESSTFPSPATALQTTSRWRTSPTAQFFSPFLREPCSMGPSQVCPLATSSSRGPMSSPEPVESPAPSSPDFSLEITVHFFSNSRRSSSPVSPPRTTASQPAATSTQCTRISQKPLSPKCVPSPLTPRSSPPGLLTAPSATNWRVTTPTPFTGYRMFSILWRKSSTTDVTLLEPGLHLIPTLSLTFTSPGHHLHATLPTSNHSHHLHVNTGSG